MVRLYRRVIVQMPVSPLPDLETRMAFLSVRASMTPRSLAFSFTSRSMVSMGLRLAPLAMKSQASTNSLLP